MSPNDNRGPGRHPWSRGKDYVSRNNPNVVYLQRYFQREITPDPARAFQALTHALVMKRSQEGTLDPAVVAALLQAVGVHP